MRGLVEPLPLLHLLPAFAVAGERAFGAGMAPAHGLGQGSGFGAGLKRVARLDLAEFVLVRQRPEPGPPVCGSDQPGDLRLEAQDPEHRVGGPAGDGRIPRLLQPGQHDLRLVALSVRFHERRMRRKRSTT